MKKLLFPLILALSLLSASSNAQVGRWYNYDDYVINNAPAATGAFDVYSIYMWNDTTAKFYSSGAPGYLYNHFVSAGMSFAPRLNAWNDHTVYGSSIKVGPNDAFIIDSVRIQGAYRRPNALTAVRDTVRIALVSGDGTSTTNLLSVGLTGGHYGSINFIDMLYDSVKNMAGKNPAVVTAPYVQTVILTNTDTSDNYYKSIALSTPFPVAAGKCASASLTFKSGDASFFAGDTVVYASGAYKHGVFMPYVVSYSSTPGVAEWAPFDPIDSNMGYFGYKPQGSWSGYYVPTWAWLSNGAFPSAYQYPVIEYHVKCTTCRLNEDIAGTTTVCVGGTSTLTHGLSGGTWSSSTAAIATVVSGTGVVSGVASGTATITYNVSGNFTTTVVTVTGLPAAGIITGASSVCEGATLFLSPTVSGGTWSSSNVGVATVNAFGDVIGVSGGTVVISYTTTNSCGSSSATRTISVNPLPDPGTITGSTGLCVGGTTTLASTVAGGTWTAFSSLITVSATGVVTGVAAGVDIVTYTATNACGPQSATTAVTVDVMPVAGTLSGAAEVCIGAAIILTPTATGGTWTASNGNATVSATGDVTGVTAGPVTISYTITNPCGSASVTQLVTVNDCTSGVQQVSAAANNVSVFPNPAHDNITITALQDISTVAITNMVGQRVAGGNYSGRKVVINIAQLPQGIYTVRVNNNSVYKIVKQ